MDSNIKKILVIAPHCDDEIIGCGGIMKRLINEGKDVYVAILTNGHLGAPELFSEAGTLKVRSEAIAAHQFLGVRETYFLDFPAPRLDTVPLYQIALRLSSLVQDLKIDTLFVPHRGDIHKDHRIAYEASLVAARPINNCPVKRVYAYETLSETEWAAPFGDDVFIPTMFVNIESTIEAKKKAFSFFTTQIKEFPHPRSLESIENLSKMRGATVGMKNTEAFMVVREIQD